MVDGISLFFILRKAGLSLVYKLVDNRYLRADILLSLIPFVKLTVTKKNRNRQPAGFIHG